MHPQPRQSYKTLVLPVFLTAVLFFFICLAFIPLIGIQNDESLFASVIYGPIAGEFRLRAFKHDIPLMVMTYLGAFKTWLYTALYSIWTPGIWSLRIPPVLAGSATIALFSLLLYKAGKLRLPAIAGAILLAVDPSFVTMTVYDWGPVAFQHLFLVSTCLLLLLFANNGRISNLFLGFLCLGLGLWDKALLSWSIAGLVLATVAVFPKELRKLLTLRHLGIAALGFVIGGAPLVLYNIRHELKTFRGNAKLEWSEVAPKWVHVKSTLDGSALFGYLVREEWEEKSVAPTTTLARMSYDLRQAAGERRVSWGYWAFVVSALAVPVWWRKRRAVLFALLYLAGAWVLMAATHDAGASGHHVVLLWPFPQFVVAITLGCLAERAKWASVLAGVLVGLIGVQSFLVLNQYYTQGDRFCGGTVWSDAIFPLHKRLVSEKPAMINVLDWGMEYALIMLEKGKLPLRNAAAHVGEETPSVDDRNAIQAILEEPGAIFLSHTQELEVQPGMAKRFDQQAVALGYQRESVETVADRCGRPTFELFRYAKATAAPISPKP